MNNCFSIYHTNWIISGPKRYFICDKRSEILKSLVPAAQRWIHEVLANHLRVNQSECAKSTIHLCVVYTKVIYYTLNSLSLFWLVESTQWIFEISVCDVISADYRIIMSRALKVTGNHVKFVQFVLLAISEEAKTWHPFFSFNAW